MTLSPSIYLCAFNMQLKKTVERTKISPCKNNNCNPPCNKIRRILLESHYYEPSVANKFLIQQNVIYNGNGNVTDNCKFSYTVNLYAVQKLWQPGYSEENHRNALALTVTPIICSKKKFPRQPWVHSKQLSKSLSSHSYVNALNNITRLGFAAVVLHIKRRGACLRQ